MGAATPPHKIPHESGAFHVTGEAVYVDDILVHERLLHGHVYTSPHAHARILGYDLSAARAHPGIHAILTHADIPGENNMGPVVHDEPVLAVDTVTFIGQAIFVLAADDEETALAASKLIEIEYELLTPVLSIEQAIEKGTLLQPPRKIECGDIEKAFAVAPHIIEGKLHVGGQEHWYLETQACLCLPGEGKEIVAISSTQHPSETQALIAEVLHIPRHEVVVQVRRMGGAFGGKETQANHTACWAALLAQATGRPVKIRLFRDDDQIMTGKRHPYLLFYKAGFDDDGRILAIDVDLNSDAGATTDLTMAIMERAMFHSDNSYYIPNMRMLGRAWKTNVTSNTAFRGFGGPQGMAGIETIVDRIARTLGKDSADVRFVNFYGMDDRNVTPYSEVVQNNRLYMLWDQLLASSDYHKRREAINAFNAQNEFTKRGMALTPVKFGISFTTSFLNQAGALVNIYQDGTVLVNHGGTEMGQGLHTKMKVVAAHELGVSADRIKVNATDTSKVPNTSATAASSGSDLNGMAVKNAIEKLKSRIAGVAAVEFTKRFAGDNGNVPSQPEDIVFADDTVHDKAHPTRRMAFADIIPLCVLNQVSLSASGYYRTPGIHFDKDKGKGNPFFYYAFGMAVTEVEVDTLTGHHQMLRADILHDVGETLNPRIDIGQIEGGFIQGVGWCTTEELKWNAKGYLLNHSPDTYKIPNVQDIPRDFRVQLLEGAPNPTTIRRSKAVGEPPFMLCFSAWLAIKDALSAIADHKLEPDFRLPATNEVILLSADKLRQQLKAEKVEA